MTHDQTQKELVSSAAVNWADKTGQVLSKHARLATVLFGLIIALITALVYSNTLHSPFVLDDHASITQHRHIRITELSVESLADSIHEKSNRPIPIISFALNYYIGQYNLPGYHLVNIAIHALNGILLLIFLNATLHGSTPQQTSPEASYFLPATGVAFFSAVLWVVHPVNTQSVTYIVQRMNSMAALFSLLVLIFYVYGRQSTDRRRRLTFYGIATGTWVLALGSKETTTILPFVILLYEWYFFQDLDIQWLKRSLWYFLGAGIVFIVLASIYLGSDPIGKLSTLRDFAEAKFTLTERILTQFRVVVYYIGLFFTPHPSRLNLDYDFALSHSLFDPVTTLFSALLLAGLIFAGIVTAKKHRLISFCIFWYFLNLVIESSVIPLAIIFEHRTYMPFMGLALLTALMVDRVFKIFSLKVGLLCLMIAVSAFWTYQRNETWQDPITLWQDVVSKSPAKARPYNNLAHALHEKGEVDAAIATFKAALDIEPHNLEVLNNLGRVFMDQNKANEAIAYFEVARAHYPQDKATLNNLGLALKKQKKPNEAIAQFKAALQTDPEFTDALNNIGLVLRDQNRNEEAAAYFKAALQADPDFVEGLNNLGAALLDLGKTAQAIAYFKAALDIDPDYKDALNNLGAALINQSNPGAAVKHFKAVLENDPGNVAALNHLGLVHISEGDTTEGLKLFTIALKLAPDDAETHVNLGATHLKLEQFDRAVLHLEKALNLDPVMVPAHTNLGIVLIQLGEFAKGYLHLQRALELNPDDEQAQANLGRAQMMKQQLENSIKNLVQAANLDPSNPKIHADLADLYRSIGDNTAAINALNKALALNPSSDTLLNSLGNLYLSNNNYEKAMQVFEKHLSLDPSFSLPYYNIARWHAKQGNTLEAVDWLQKAISRGYANWEKIKSDPDLESVRKTAEYEKLMEGRLK